MLSKDKLINKKSILLHKDTLEFLKEISKDQVGEIFLAILSVEEGEEPNFSSPLLKAIFLPIRNHLERNQEKWWAICERNRANGALGGRPVENPEEPNETQSVNLGFKNNPEEPNKTQNNHKQIQDTDTNTKTDTDTKDNNINNNSPQVSADAPNGKPSESNANISTIEAKKEEDKEKKKENQVAIKEKRKGRKFLTNDDFQRILNSPEELHKYSLATDLTVDGVKYFVGRIRNYCESSGKKYVGLTATIKNWVENSITRGDNLPPKYFKPKYFFDNRSFQNLKIENKYYEFYNEQEFEKVVGKRPTEENLIK